MRIILLYTGPKLYSQFPALTKLVFLKSNLIKSLAMFSYSREDRLDHAKSSFRLMFIPELRPTAHDPGAHIDRLLPNCS